MRSKKSSAEILQDLPFQRRQWRIQRVGWVVALVILLLGGLGLFGDGPLSHVRAGSPSLQVEYERFIRRDNPMQLRIDAEPDGEGRLALAVTRDYMHSLRVESILPYPERVESHGTDLVFVFRASAPGESVRITFNVSPLEVGKLHGRMSLAGHPAAQAVLLDQFTFP